jgi:alpha-amylase/alpha-mannosidase (GH57 family)
LTDIVLVFEVHQPHRIKRNFFWESKMFERVDKKDYFDYYFDSAINREVFERTSRKCYFPSNSILLELIDRYKGEKKKPKFSFSLSGVFLEQCEMFNKDLLETFKQLAESGQVEFLSQTYYHSLASLYPEREEFIEQVKMHQQVMSDLLDYRSTVFENTELLYNNAVARTVEKLGYKGIFTEGVERILHGKSPNHLYWPKGLKKIKILLRNYKLTDDIGFRFSARWWSEWPLTADKYASWLAATPGECINIFPDYETFGEHHWPETGIHDFLRHLPPEILKWWNLQMVTPSEVAQKHVPAAEIDVPELLARKHPAVGLLHDVETLGALGQGDRGQRIPENVAILSDKRPPLLHVHRRRLSRRGPLILQPIQHANGRLRNRASSNTGLRKQSQTRRYSRRRTFPILHGRRRKKLHRNNGLEPERLHKSHSQSEHEIPGIPQQPRRLRTVGSEVTS